MDIISYCNNFFKLLSVIKSIHFFEADGREFIVGKDEDFSETPENTLACAFFNNRRIYMRIIERNDCYSYEISTGDFNLEKLDKIPISGKSKMVAPNIGNYLYKIVEFLKSITSNFEDENNGIVYGISSDFENRDKKYGVVYFNDFCIFRTKDNEIVKKLEERYIPLVFTNEYVNDLRNKQEIAISGMFGESIHPDDLKFLMSVDTINTYNFTSKTSRIGNKLMKIKADSSNILKIQSNVNTGFYKSYYKIENGAIIRKNLNEGNKKLHSVEIDNVYEYESQINSKWIADAFSFMLLYTTPKENGKLFSQLLTRSFLSKNCFNKKEEMRTVITSFSNLIRTRIVPSSTQETSFAFKIASNFLANVSPSEGIPTADFFNDLMETIKFIEICFTDITCEYGGKTLTGSDIYSDSNIIPYLFGQEKEIKAVVVSQKKTVKKEDLSHLTLEEQAAVKREKLELKKEQKKISKYEAADNYDYLEDRY